MERMPVIEVVEIDGVADLAFVPDPVRAEDGGADVVGVDVTGDRGVELFDRSGIEGSAGLGENPGFKLRIGRLFVGDEFLKDGFVECESVEHHLVIALATRRVVGVELASSAERGLEPKAWQVEDAEGTGDAGTD